jgi:hypothetical protein
MPYLLVIQAVVLWLTFQYARTVDVSGRSKRLVVGLAVASCLASYLWPQNPMPAALLLMAIGVYLAVRQVIVAPPTQA